MKAATCLQIPAFLELNHKYFSWPPLPWLQMRSKFSQLDFSCRKAVNHLCSSGAFRVKETLCGSSDGIFSACRIASLQVALTQWENFIKLVSVSKARKEMTWFVFRN